MSQVRKSPQVASAIAMTFLLIMITSLPSVEIVGGEQAVSCVKYPGNPVLVGGSNDSWDSGGVFSPSVIFNGSSFNMFYTGYNGNYRSVIGLATSSDGVRWAKLADPVLPLGANGTWDSQSVYFPAVIWNGSEYLMYYTGYNQTAIGIGVAFSEDLVHWEKYPGNPVMTPGPGAYDSVGVTSHAVMLDHSVYKMWYSGRYPVNYTHSIGYATSTDGLHWTKYPGNPVITRSTNNDSYTFGPWGPTVVKVDSQYIAAYETDGLVSSAISPDGIHWTASLRPLLQPSNQSTGFDYTIENPLMLLVNSTVYLWFTGISFAGPQPYSIGFSFCGLSPLVLITTVTSISTSTVATTSISQLTVTRTSTTTQPGSTTSLPLYEASTAILAVMLVATLGAILARRRRADY